MYTFRSRCWVIVCTQNNSLDLNIQPVFICFPFLRFYKVLGVSQSGFQFQVQLVSRLQPSHANAGHMSGDCTRVVSAVLPRRFTHLFSGLWIVSGKRVFSCPQLWVSQWWTGLCPWGLCTWWRTDCPHWSRLAKAILNLSLFYSEVSEKWPIFSFHGNLCRDIKRWGIGENQRGEGGGLWVSRPSVRADLSLACGLGFDLTESATATIIIDTSMVFG